MMKSVRKKESQPRRSVHAKKRRVRGPLDSSNQKQCYRPSARAMTLFDEKDELEEDLDEDDLGHEDVECDDEDENNGISEDEF
ncbi:hypothetical protein IGI04_034674 [Brassica rapa subsp. trilocularis]|uniref:Uncharacterized protein n=1 Tax=Brassica rapa subsp. trilocularis TaxID=1813537 RepID=A0ABQ7LC96_BRACM|nr:hypothetical protein IGI04_034674 [Brassica rapa subsp. trilocularis]